MRLKRVKSYKGPEGSYQFQISFRKDESPSGKARDRRRKVFAAPSEAAAWELADAWMDEFRPAVALGTSRDLVDALTASIGAMEKLGRIGGLTAYQYRGLVSRYVKPRFGGIDVSALAPYQVVGMYAELAGGGLGPASLKQLHSCLTGAYAWMRDVGLVDANPMERVPAPVGARPPRRPVSDADLAKVVRAIADALSDGSTETGNVRYRNHAMAMYLELMTGQRGSEVAALTRADFDLYGRTVFVGHHIQDVPGRGLVRVYGTKGHRQGRSHRVSVAAGVCRMVEAHMEWQEAYLRAPRTSTPVITYDGGFVRPGNVTKEFAKLARTLGLPEGVTLHSLRHTHAVQLNARGIGAKEIQERLGHARIATTMDIYANEIVEARDRAGADAMAAVWEEKGGGDARPAGGGPEAAAR